MDGQNFENENNITVDTTATEIPPVVEPVPETPITEQPVGNYYQDYTTNAQPQAAPTVVNGQTGNNEPNVLAIVGLVLGILSILFGCCAGVLVGWLGILFGIGGVICSVVGNKQSPSGLAKAGLICSIIGIVFGILLTIFMIVVLVGTELAAY